MNNNLNEKINILFLSDVGKFLKNTDIKYVIEKDADKLKVKELPIIYTNNMYELYYKLAYDYDTLSDKLKKEYQLQYKTLIKKGDYYEYDVKKYIKKNSNK